MLRCDGIPSCDLDSKRKTILLVSEVGSVPVPKGTQTASSLKVQLRLRHIPFSSEGDHRSCLVSLEKVLV
jgi:hypothetical protein